jgi:hypothetical protein
VPPPTQSPATTKSNASTPRVYAERRATDARRGSESSEDGAGAGRRPIGHRRPHQLIGHDDPDITPRSHHSNANRIASSASATALPPARFNFDEREVGRKKTPRPSSSGAPAPAADSGGTGGGGEKWKCENPKCLKWNTGPDYCEFCAIRRGATGARGAAAKIYIE